MNLRTRFSLVILALMALAQAMFAGAYFFLQRRAELSETYRRSMETLRLAAAVCHESSLTKDWTKSHSHFAFLREDPTVRYADCAVEDGPSLVGGDAPATIPDGARELSRSFALADGRRARARVGYDGDAVNASVHERLRSSLWDMGRVASVTLLLGLVAAFFVARTLTRPIEALASGARALGDGDLDHRVPDDGREDELGHLREGFNTMAEHLAETDRMKKNFVQSVTHDLKSPLAGIKACLETLHAGGSGKINEKQRRYLASSLDAAERLWDYLDDMLSVMKLQTGHYPIEKTPLDPAALLADAVDGYALRAENAVISLKKELDDDLPKVLADAALFRRVVDNLLTNAMNYTPRGGSIAVRARREEDRVRIEVRDTGPGIPKESRERVFESFYQASRPPEPGKPKGTGLGLAVCRSIVLEHGGTIKAECPAGGGTRIVFTLPAA